MLTRVACSNMPGAKSLQTNAVTNNAFRLTSASPLLKAGHHQQIRTFRFGMWSSYRDPEFQRELQHRHRMLRHKYAEALNRRLSWDQHSLHGHPKAVVKYMLRRYWHPARARCGSRAANDEMSGRPHHGRGTDTGDPRMANPWAYSSWWGGYSSHYTSSSRNYNTWKSQLDEALNHWTERNPKSKNTTRTESSHYSTKSQPATETKSSGADDEQGINISSEDYIIDPITNRKVPRSTYGSVEDIDPSSTESFRAYRAQFTTFAPPKDEAKQSPIYSDGPPPPAELKEYGQINVDHLLSDDAKFEGHDGTAVLGDNTENYNYRNPDLQGEEYALNHLPPEESVEQYEDLDKYQTYQKDGPHEQVPDTTEKYEDLDQYKTYGPEETANEHAEVAGDRSELNDYNPDQYDEITDITKQTTQYDDLHEYGPYKHEEDKTKDELIEKYDDLDSYEHYNDEGKPVDSPIPKYDDLNRYDTTNFQDTPTEEQPFQQYGDLENYRTFKHQELDNENKPERDIVAESLREFDAKEQEVNSDETPQSSIANRLRKLDLSDASSTLNNDSAQAFSSSHQNDRNPAAKTETREFLEQAMTSHIAASDVADREASSNVGKLRTSTPDDKDSASQDQLTGNYVRDFPEQFSGSWSPESRSLDQKATDVQAAEKQFSDQLSRSMNSLKLETSLDRQQAEPKLESALDQQETQSTKGMFNHHSTTEAEVDPYSREPQGLETSYTRECDDEAPTFIKTYGGEPLGVVWEHTSSERDLSQSIQPFESLYHRDPEIDGLPVPPPGSDPKTKSGQAAKPTVYKILAYDPTMQKINIAETTSIVPDQASPLTPADALLRLSNPTKFFPHFAPLQAEGFEIVSGGGDVLVFRQVRLGKVAHTGTPPVNPIDMMGKPTALPNAAAFVSPTGFVNYDMPQVEEETQTTPFRSNIDVRREEPVFSGPKSPTAEELRKQKKKGVGRRVLIGGAWVAGISYALGVVSEYFLTGGADGKGPTGF